MPAVTLLGHRCTGHGCYPPRPNVEGSGNVFANDIPVHRQDDAWHPHGCGDCTPHSSETKSGSQTVYVNGKQMARIGDPVKCGSKIAQGTGNVFCGG